MTTQIISCIISELEPQESILWLDSGEQYHADYNEVKKLISDPREKEILDKVVNFIDIVYRSLPALDIEILQLRKAALIYEACKFDHMFKSVLALRAFKSYTKLMNLKGSHRRTRYDDRTKLNLLRSCCFLELTSDESRFLADVLLYNKSAEAS